MSQGNQSVADGDGFAVRTAINVEFGALYSLSSGTSAPTTTVAYMLWADTTNNVLWRRNAANSGWIAVCSLDETFMISRSSNTVLALSDKGKSFIATGTFTQTLTAAATLKDGWNCYIYNAGSGVITIDPNGSETINGAATLALAAGEGGYLITDGTQFYLIGSLSAGTSTANLAGNALINGRMDIWQRGTTFTTVPTSTYTADRWQYGKSGSVVHTLEQSTDVPTVAQCGYVANYSLKAQVTTAVASVGSTDFAEVFQVIEGFNWAAYAQQIITASFWVKAAKTGIHTISLDNGADRSIVSEYTINTANTWEYKTVTFAASPSGGTWNYTNGVGVSVHFFFMGGSTYQSSTFNTWKSDVLTVSANQVNETDSTSNAFLLHGVQLELGSTASPFQHRPYTEEFNQCLRYFYHMDNEMLGNAINAAAVGGGAIFPAVMRTTPTISNGSFTVSGGSAGTFAANNITERACQIFNSANNWTTYVNVQATCDISAEL